MKNVTVPPRTRLITLACRDPARTARAFRLLGRDVAWAAGSTFDDRGGLTFP